MPKIANAGAIGSRNEINSNNIALGRSFAGQLFMPALGVTAWVIICLFRAKWEMLFRRKLRR
jgi:hypothetical protein